MSSSSASSAISIRQASTTTSWVAAAKAVRMAKPPQRRQLHRRIGRRHTEQADRRAGLHPQEPAAPASHAVEQGRGQIVHHRAPDELQRIGHADPAQETDQGQVHMGVAEPVAEGVADQQERQPRSETQPQHHGDLGTAKGYDHLGQTAAAALGGGGFGMALVFGLGHGAPSVGDELRMRRGGARVPRSAAATRRVRGAQVHRCRTARSAVGDRGLVRKSSMPAARQAWRSSSKLLAVRATMAVSIPRSRRPRQTARPSMSGKPQIHQDQVVGRGRRRFQRLKSGGGPVHGAQPSRLRRALARRAFTGLSSTSNTRAPGRRRGGRPFVFGRLQSGMVGVEIRTFGARRKVVKGRENPGGDRTRGEAA